MKLYLSSYKLGDNATELEGIVSKLYNKKTAYISNALDFSDDQARREKSEQNDIDQLSELKLEVEKVDLRGYFGKKDALEKALRNFGVIWVCGGNLFVLRQAMRLSGFDEIFKKLVSKNILYGGYSAGVCVLSPTLKGMDLMDDATLKPYGNSQGVIWCGLGAINYSVVPHYKSNHPESRNATKVVNFMIKNKIPFVALQDGEAIII
jgi:dipeptidase E